MGKNRAGMCVSLYMDTSVDTTKTSAAIVPAWARYGMVYIPNITNAAVSCEIIEEKDFQDEGYDPSDDSLDTDGADALAASADTGWKAVADEAESTQIAASGVEDKWVDISHFIRALPPNCAIRFVQGSAETGGAKLTYRLALRGA